MVYNIYDQASQLSAGSASGQVAKHRLASQVRDSVAKNHRYDRISARGTDTKHATYAGLKKKYGK